MQVSFTSVIPVNVYINGKPSTDKKHIQQGCKEAVKVMAGPTFKQPQHRIFINRLSIMDPEFDAQKAWNGYCKDLVKQNGDIIHQTPSDYFKIIFDKKGRAYITTGVESQDLSEIGRHIGLERTKCKERGYSDSFELASAQNTYWSYIKAAINNPYRRIREEYNKFERVGSPMAIDVYVNAKECKRAGKSVLKMSLEDLGFSQN